MDNQEKKTRQSQWFAVAAFSIIALVSITSNFVNKIKDEDKAVKWAVSAVSIALTFSTLAVFASVLLKEKFVNTPMEGGLALFTFGFWAAVLPAIMHPGNGLAVSDLGGAIYNHNLYFFSWAAFLTSLFVFVGYLKQFFVSDVEADGPKRRCSTVSWSALIATSFVVMIAAGRQYQEWHCANYTGNTNTNSQAKNQLGQLYNDVCKRVEYAVSLGTISACIGLLWIAVAMCMKGKWGDRIDCFLVWLLLIFWTCGVSYITFNKNKSPATQIGNLYFFTWGSWALNVFMAMTGLQNCLNREETSEEPKPEADVENKDVEDVAVAEAETSDDAAA